MQGNYIINRSANSRMFRHIDFCYPFEAIGLLYGKGNKFIVALPVCSTKTKRSDTSLINKINNAIKRADSFLSEFKLEYRGIYRSICDSDKMTNKDWFFANNFKGCFIDFCYHGTETFWARPVYLENIDYDDVDFLQTRKLKEFESINHKKIHSKWKTIFKITGYEIIYKPEMYNKPRKRYMI